MLFRSMKSAIKWLEHITVVALRPKRSHS